MTTTTAAPQLPDLPEPPDAAGHPVVTYAVVAAAVLYVVALAIAKAADPVSAALEKRRNFKQRAEDARIVDLDAQVDHLAGRVFTLEQRQQAQDLALYAHALWDAQVIEAALAGGIDLASTIGPPPPLRPPTPPDC